MYITYESTQWAKDPSDPIRIGQFVLPPGRMPETLPKPDFMPSKLIRTSDMKVVSGTQVNEGYCAFSYAWSQSGDILVDPRTGKKNRFDQGKHKLIRPTASKQHPGNVEEYVRFETIIQQICRDFNIKYVWYDALCIDHNNLEEKHQDIGQMHRIYYNAYCVVALVPEFCIKVKSSRERKRLSQQDETADTYCRFLDALDEIPTAAWSKRLWTLTEAIQSQNLIYVGQNVHVFSDQEVPGVKHISQVKQRFARWNVGTMLFYAHKRTSTSDHDRVFAMANLFPDLMKHISIDYDQPFEDLMIQFYSLLAKKCITILFFGSHKKYKGKATIYQNAHDDDHNNEAIEDYDATSNDNKSDTISIRDDCNTNHLLPSWTGIEGEHRLFEWGEAITTFKNYDVVGRIMRVTCTNITSNPSSYNDSLTVRYEDLPAIPMDRRNTDSELWITVQLPGQASPKNISLHPSFYDIDEEDLNAISQELRKLSKFMPIHKKNLRWSEASEIACGIEFDLTEDMGDADDECVILSGIVFNSNYYSHFRSRYYPVIKKQPNNHHKAIGVCRVFKPEYFFTELNLPEQIFTIQ